MLILLIAFWSLAIAAIKDAICASTADETVADAVSALAFSAAVAGPVPVVPDTVHVPEVAGAFTLATATPPSEETVVAVALYVKLPVIPRLEVRAADKILA